MEKIITPYAVFGFFYIAFLGIGSIVTFGQNPDISTFSLLLLAVVLLTPLVFDRVRIRRSRFVALLASPVKSQLPTSSFVAALGALATLLVAFLYLARFGVPLLDANPEYARIEGIQKAGGVFRIIMTNVPFFALYLTVIASARSESANGTSTPAALRRILIVSLFVLPILLAFRSVTLDGLLLLLFARAVQLVAEGKASGESPRVVIAKLSRVVRQVSLPLSLGLVAVVAVTAVRAASVGLETGAPGAAFLQRLVMENVVVNLRGIFDLFSSRDLLYGSGILMDLSALTPFGVKSFAMWVTYEINPFTGDTFVMTPTFAGEAYANFGWMGLLVSPLLLHGLFSVLSEVACSRRRITIEDKTVFVFLLYYFPRTCVTHGMGAAFVLTLVPSLLLWGMSTLAVGLLRKSYGSGRG